MHRDDSTAPSQWSTDFRKLLGSINSTSHQITSTLALLSSSLGNGQPLPPYLEVPKPFQFIKTLNSIDPDLLSVRHIAEPEYSAFAVIQICAQAVNADIAQLTKYVFVLEYSPTLQELTRSRHVKAVVGEINFSFHAIKPSGSSSDSASVDDDDDTKFKHD